MVQTFLGHNARCFDVKVNPLVGDQFLSSSEDGSAKLWSISRKVALHTMVHNKAAEVLRSTFLNDKICTAGSDSKIKIWNRAEETGSMTDILMLGHDRENAQIYVCESPHGTTSSSICQLLSAADNELVTWDLNIGRSIRTWQFYTDSELSFGGVDRNPDSENYIFDAKFQPNNGNIVGLAMSNSCFKLTDFRSACDEPTLQIDIDRRIGHVTSVCWSLDGLSCFVGSGSGQLAMLDIRMSKALGLLPLHARPCYGITTSGDDAYLSWSSDGTIIEWGFFSDDNSESGAECVIFNSITVPDMNVLSCALTPDRNFILCCGESKTKGANSFLGVPIFMVDLPSGDEKEAAVVEEQK